MEAIVHNFHIIYYTVNWWHKNLGAAVVNYITNISDISADCPGDVEPLLNSCQIARNVDAVQIFTKGTHSILLPVPNCGQ